MERDFVYGMDVDIKNIKREKLMHLKCGAIAEFLGYDGKIRQRKGDS